MKISFYLVQNKIDKKGYAPIYYSLTLNGQRIRKQVKGVKCNPSHWKSREQRLKVPNKSEEYNFHIEYNRKLDELEGKFNTLFRYIHLNDIAPTKEYILDKIESNEINHVRISNKFFPSFQEFIDTNKSTKSPRTIKTYVTNKNFLEAFEISTGYKLHFDSITIDFYEKLRDYAFNVKKARNNYFSKIIAVLKTFMNWANERGYHENFTYQKFKKLEDDTEVIYLTMNELLKLYNHDFESKRLDHVRDVYCFGCFTGLRYSDIKQLKPSNVFEDHLKLNIQKTKTMDHIIPLNSYSSAILKKY